MNTATCFGSKPTSSWRCNTKAYVNNTSAYNANNKILKMNTGSRKDKNMVTVS